MSGMLVADADAARKAGVDAYYYQAFDQSRAAFEALLQVLPSDPVALMHLSLLRQEQGEAEQALALLKAAASADLSYATAKSIAVYLSRRRRVREGAAFEDGWLTLLELALLSGVLPQNTIEGLAALPPNQSEAHGIPRRIMQYWDKPTPPDEVVSLMQRCRAANPGYVHDLFDDATAQDFLATQYGTGLVDLYRACFHVSAKADFFRLAYLYKQGGFYIDADEVCDRPLDSCFRTGEVEQVYTFSRGLPSCVNNWFIGAAPGTRIIERTLDNCMGNMASVVRHGRKSNVWVLTGPGVLTFSILDLFCQPAEHLGGRAFGRTVLLEEGEYRQLFEAPPMQYKNDKDGNWRMIG